MKNTILKINGFKLGHLVVASFWWMFWAAIKSNFTGNKYWIGNAKSKQLISVGNGHVSDALWNEGWTVSLCGRIFTKYILYYRK